MPVKSKRKTYRSDIRAASVDEGRARIIDAARKLLAGGKDVPVFSVDAVAREAGVTRLTVYNQFESKRGLLEAVFDAMAQQGGLSDLPSVFAEPDAVTAFRRLVTVFCRFWALHGEVMPKFSALAKLDDEIVASLKQRSERRRQVLTTLANRWTSGRAVPDLVDILFALTSFEFFEALSVRRRSHAAIEDLIWQLAESSLNRFHEK